MGYGAQLWGEALWGSPEFENVLELGASSIVQTEAALVLAADSRIDDPALGRTDRPFRISRIFYPGATASFFLENLRVDGMDYNGPAPQWRLNELNGHASFTRIWDSKREQLVAWQASVPVPETPGEYTLYWTINTGVVLRQYEERILVVAFGDRVV